MKKNNQEVEVRVILSPQQRRSFFTTLKQRAAYHGKEELIDVYLCPQSATSFKEIEMNEVGSYSLRLRKRSDARGIVIHLNSKIITRKGDHNAWKEHEVALDSLEETLAILKAIGFKPYFTLEKTRHKFILAPFTILLEDIKGFKPILEIEIMTTHRKVEQAKRLIYGFLKKFSIKKEQTVRKSVTNLLMHERASF